MQQKKHFHPSAEQPAQEGFLFSPDAAVSEYTRLSIRPSISTSPCPCQAVHMQFVATDHQHPLFRLQQDLPQIRKDVILHRSRYMSVCWSWSLYAYVLSRFKSSITLIASHPPIFRTGLTIHLMGKCGNLYLIFIYNESSLASSFSRSPCTSRTSTFTSLLPKRDGDDISPLLHWRMPFAGLSLINTLPLSQASLATVTAFDQAGHL